MIATLIQKIKDARNKRNERIDRIIRVEDALKGVPDTTAKEQDKEALELSKKTGLPYEDTLAYVQQKRKTEAGKEKIKSAVVGILKAGKEASMNVERSGFFGNGESILDNNKMYNESIFSDREANQPRETIFRIPDSGKHHRKTKQKSRGGKQVIINLG